MSDFRITITAVDKATAAVNRVKDRIAQTTKPIRNLRNEFRGLEEALGLPKIGKGITKIGGAAVKTARSINHIVTPLAAITGVASIAGMTAMVDRWSRFGSSITYAAQGIGIGTTELQRWRQVGTLAGVSSDAVASSLEGLGKTMEDARWGRNQGALMLFNRLGVGLKKTKDGAWDVTGEMKALARVIDSPKLRHNPWAQQLVASQLGVTAMLPILRQGEKGLARYEAMQKKLGYASSPEAIANANRFAVSLAGMKIATEGLGQSIMDTAMPVMRPFVDQLSGWVAKNRDLISQDIAGVVKSVASYIRGIDWGDVGKNVTGFFRGAKGFATDIQGIAHDVAASFKMIGDAGHFMRNTFQQGGSLDQALGMGNGYTSADHAMYAAQHANDAAFKARRARMADMFTFDRWKKLSGNDHWWESDSALKETYQHFLDDRAAASAQGEGRGATKTYGGMPKGTQSITDFFVRKGWSRAQASGLAANLFEESHYKTNKWGDNGNAYGIGQWHAPRQSQFYKWSGHNIQQSTLEEQLGFVNYELTRGDYKNVGDALRHAQSASTAGDLVSRYYERPDDADGAAADRAGLAELIDRKGAPTGPYSAARGGAGAAGAAGATGTVHVEVEMKSAPPGTTAKAKATGNTTASVTVPRIGYSTIGNTS